MPYTLNAMSAPRLSAAYSKSINGTDRIIEDVKQKVTFLGRSNVGKSSLINSLIGHKLARSSSKPGKTVKLDFFLIENAVFFVDLPGYGYAKRSKEAQEHYRKLIAWYLFRSGVNHKLAVLIVDAKVGFTDYDRESVGLLTDNGIPFVIAANKIDKLDRKERAAKIGEIIAEANSIRVVPYSSVTGEGRDELLSIIFS